MNIINIIKLKSNKKNKLPYKNIHVLKIIFDDEYDKYDRKILLSYLIRNNKLNILLDKYNVENINFVDDVSYKYYHKPIYTIVTLYTY